MFFVPRIGTHYHEGFQGHRTLILGAHHVCLPECEHKAVCCTPQGVITMDHRCPFYQHFPPPPPDRPEEEMCLHNSNIIEIDAFCDDEAGYPTYSAFTKFILHRKTPLSIEEKFDFWDRVAFTNLLQCYVPQKVVPAYSEKPDFYNVAIPSLKELLADLQPEAIYVWERITYEALTANLDQLPGLRQESLMPEHPTMDLYLFSYNTKPITPDINLIRQHIQSIYPERTILPRREAWLTNYPLPLENVLLNALKRGLLTFSDGLFVINPDRPEKEGGHFIHLLRNQYNFNSYEDLDKLIVKYNKQGEPMSLRQIRHYNNTTNENMLSNDLERMFFKSK